MTDATLIKKLNSWKEKVENEKITNILSYNFGGRKSAVIFPGLKSRCQQGHVPS